MVKSPSKNGVVKPTERELFDLGTLLARAGFGRAKFTDAEQACISAKITTLLDEGTPRDQAVAIAISECAPETARQMARSSAAAMRAFSSLRLEPEDGAIARDVLTSLPGRDLEAVQNEDGTWNILDVPIMAEHIMPEDGTTYIGRRWMERCMAIVRARMENQDDPYTPPLHLIHHGTGKPERIGSWIPTSVRSMKFGGVDTDTMFADLICISDYWYQCFRRGEIPYVSIESYDVTSYEVDSLAALDHDAPFFKFGNNRVVREFPHPNPNEDSAYRAAEKAPTAWDYRGEDTGPLIGVASDGMSRHAALFRFDTFLKEENEMNRGKAPTAASRQSQDTDNKDDAPEGADRMEGLTLDDALAFLSEVMPKLQKVMEVISGGNAEESEAPAEQPEEAMMADDEEKMMADDEEKMMADDDEHKLAASRSAESEGIHKAMIIRLKRLESAEAERSAEADINSALNDLVELGAPKDATRKDLVAFRSQSKEALDQYVASMKRVLGEDPPKGATGATQRGAGASELAMKVAASGGPEAIRLADQYAREYDTMRKSMRGIGKKEDYVRRQLVKAGLVEDVNEEEN